MKAVLEFELPADNTDFLHATMATELALVLWDVAQELRNRTKHPDPRDCVETLERFNEAFHGLLCERGVDLDRLAT